MDTNPIAASTASTTATTPLQITIRPESQNTPPLWSGENQAPSFKDVLDTINPLQHIPIVSNIYQAMTGDTPSSGASIIGDTLFGGAIGLIGSAFNTAVQQQTGTGIVGNILAAIEGKPVPALAQNTTDDDTTQTAENSVNVSQRTGYNAYLQTQSLLT